MVGINQDLPEVIEPDSDEARDRVWEKWRRERRKHYPDEVFPQDMDSGWENTDIAEFDNLPR